MQSLSSTLREEPTSKQVFSSERERKERERERERERESPGSPAKFRGVLSFQSSVSIFRVTVSEKTPCNVGGVEKKLKSTNAEYGKVVLNQNADRRNVVRTLDKLH